MFDCRSQVPPLLAIPNEIPGAALRMYTRTALFTWYDVINACSLLENNQIAAIRAGDLVHVRGLTELYVNWCLRAHGARNLDHNAVTEIEAGALSSLGSLRIL